MLFNRKPTQAVSPPVEEPKVDPPVVDPPVPDPPTPQFASKEDLTSLQASIYQLQDNVTNFFMKQNAPAQSTSPTLPQIEDVSDDEYEKAIMGELDRRVAAKVIQTRHSAIAKRENLALHQKIEQLQSVGMGAISNLTAQGLQAKPHYKTYKKEIDAAIAQLPPESRVNAEALNGVYNYIIGGHIEEIMAAEREVVLRQAVPKPDTGVPGNRGPGSSATPGVPEPEDVLDPSALAQIQQWYGKGPSGIEKFCRSQRTDSWDTYYNKYLKPLNETQGNA